MKSSVMVSVAIFWLEQVFLITMISSFVDSDEDIIDIYVPNVQSLTLSAVVAFSNHYSKEPMTPLPQV